MSLYYSTLYWHNWLVFTFGDRKLSDTLDDLVDTLSKKADEICESGGNAATFLADFPGLSRTQREVSAWMESQKYLRRKLESEKQYLAAIERSYFTLRHAGEWADIFRTLLTLPERRFAELSASAEMYWIDTITSLRQRSSGELENKRRL